MMKAFKILFLALFALVSTQSAGQQQLFLNQTGGAPPTAGLLDQYKGAAFAAAPDVLLYSTYSATDDIAGSLTNGQVGQWSVAVFRDFDDAIKSFTPAEVADGTANTWVQELGPSDGFVRRWYDQSVTALDVSNLNHADQESTPAMPKLFDSSTGLILENGKAAMEFNFDFLSTNYNGLVQDFSVFSVQKVTAANKVFWSYDYSFPNTGVLYRSGGSDQIILFLDDGGESDISYTFSWINMFLSVVTYDSGSVTIRNNGAQVATGTDNYATTGAISFLIGENPAFSGARFQGRMQSIILYPFEQTTNEAAMEALINNEYSIYP